MILFNNKPPIVTVAMDNEGDKATLNKIKLACPMIAEQYTRNPDLEAISASDAMNRFRVDENVLSIVTVLRGSLFLDECMLSAVGASSSSSDIVSLVALRNYCSASFSKCLFRGSEGMTRRKTVGVVAKHANLGVRECRFISCNVASLFFSGTARNQVKVTGSTISGSSYGIVALGNFSPFISRNSITSCGLVGIKAGVCSRAVISYNEIRACGIGVELISCDASLLNNKITECHRDGVLSRTREEEVARAVIKNNPMIAENQENGIRIRGINNHTRVEGNGFIGYNKLAGVMVEEEAEAHLFKNTISKNLGQGVLIAEKASAVVEKNHILDNIKAGVAFGGELSAKTALILNRIEGGRCEGVFMLECEEAWLMRNQIRENYDGVICCTSAPILQDN